MRKNKKYRPRPGIRVTREKVGSVSAGFVTGDALVPITSVTGAIMPVVGRDVSNDSAVLDASVSYGALDTKNSYDAVLRSSVTSSPTSYRSNSNVKPTWTNSHIGRNDAYVMLPFSSSRHEVTTLNCTLSGTEVLESSPVPASTPLYFSKSQRYKTITVKKTASFEDTLPGADDPIVTTNGVDTQNIFANYSGVYPGALQFSAGTGTLVALTGAFGQAPATVQYPAIFRVDVPVKGKLVDIKVWVELVHLTSSLIHAQPMQRLWIALRSPNLKWGNAIPIKNDPGYKQWDGSNVVGGDAYNQFSIVPRLFVDSFMMWEGSAVAAASFFGGIAERYPCFDKDRSMRTIFHDGAPTPSPRHLYNATSVSGNYLGSPNSFFGINAAAGCNVPWTSDRTGGALTMSYSAAGSPPPGWLTGPGKTNAVNEWPTTGVNYGATDMKPMYPFIDSVYEVKRVRSDGNLIYGGVDDLFQGADKWRGFRPGLRGTEISGTWKFMVANGDHEDHPDVPGPFPLYFRQVRLEITYEENVPVSRTIRSVTPHRAGPRRLFSVSGTDQYDGTYAARNYYVNDVYTTVPFEAEMHTTFGLVANTGTVDSNFGLLYRLTGTLADVSGSVPGWLFNNQFGMPMIPYSSASLVPSTPIPIEADQTVQDKIRPSKSLDGHRKLSDVARAVNRPVSLPNLATLFVSGSAT